MSSSSFDCNNNDQKLIYKSEIFVINFINELVWKNIEISVESLPSSNILFSKYFFWRNIKNSCEYVK